MKIWGGHIILVDEYFMDVMELQLVEGETYREGGNNKGRFLMNQQMAKEIASKSPDHTYLTEQQTGVVKDFNFKGNRCIKNPHLCVSTT